MELRTQLQQAESRLRDKRAELARARKIAEQAKASFAENESDGAYQAAQGAQEAVKTVQQEIESTQEEQIGLLRRLGDPEAGISGGASRSPSPPTAARRIR